MTAINFSKLSSASSKSEQEWKYKERMFHNFFQFTGFFIVFVAILLHQLFQIANSSFPLILQFHVNLTSKTLNFQCSQSPFQIPSS